MVRRRARGVTLMGAILLLALGAGVYWIVVFGGAHWDNHELKAVLRQAGNMAYSEHNDEMLRSFIMRRADDMFGYDVEEFGMRKRRLRVEFQPDDLVLDRSKIPPLMRIRINYSRTIKLPIIGGERQMYFALDVEQDLSPIKY